MRKLLLAGAAFVGSVGVAAAQTAMPMAPTQGMPVQYNTIMAGNNSNNSDGSPLPSSPTAPTPGSVVIHLNGRVNFYAAVSGGSLQTYGGAKTAPDQFLGYVRLYPGVDGLATNGLRYGAIIEIRQNFAGQTDNLSITPVGTNVNQAGGNFSTSPSGSSCSSTLYVRREAVYFGSNQLGIVRLGQDDGPFSQFDGGVTTFQNFNDGAWNGDVPSAVIGNSQPTFPFWSGVGAEYDITKAVYFTPQFAGFDFAASWAPGNNATNDSACATASSGCAASTSTLANSNFGGGARPVNMYELMGRYRGSFAGLGIYGIAGYSGSGHTNVPTTVGTQYDGFGVFDAGLALTFAGFTVGGNVLTGAYDGQVGLKPQGGQNATAWIAGVQYASGPLTIGASYFNYQSTGSTASHFTTQRYDDGLAAGLTYSIAPGMVGYVSYLYGQAHQGGVNIATGAAGSAYNDVHGQTFALGTRVFW